MFERYTEKARRAIFFARYECSQLGSQSIESEHLLLGILRENKTLYLLFPTSHDAIASIRKNVEQHAPVGEKISTSTDLPLSDECTRILAYAAEEAHHFSHKFIGTEHLLLGLLREPTCFAASLLRERGVSLETVRTHLGSRPPEELASFPSSPGIPSGYTSHRLLFNSVAEMLILELRRTGGLHPVPTKLFYRHKDAEAYEQIGAPSDGISYESPVTCNSLPIVVFNSLRWDKSRRGGDWQGVFRFDLRTKDLSICVSTEKLRYPEPHGRMWVVELVSLSEEADMLYVNIAIEKDVSGGAIVNHYLAKVTLPDQELLLLSPLRDSRY